VIIVEFFRDILDGIWYWLYLLFCIIAFFYVLGIVADNKREKINKKLKEKKSYDIESGKEAAIAALESKQVLAVSEEVKEKTEEESVSIEMEKNEPAVVVIESSTPVQDTTPIQITTPVENIVPSSQPMMQAQLVGQVEPEKAEPLVINSN